MEKIKFIYQIESEKHFNSLTRILSTFSRRRISIIEMNSDIGADEDLQRITLSVIETRATAVMLSKRLKREIDMLNIHLYELASQN